MLLWKTLQLNTKSIKVNTDFKVVNLTGYE